LVVEPQLPQQLVEDLRAGARRHGFANEIPVALRMQAVTPDDVRTTRLADDFRMVVD